MTDSSPKQPRSAWKRVARFLFIYCMVPYLALVGLVGILQRRLMYHPTRAASVNPDESRLPSGSVEHLSFTSDDGLTLNGWHIMPPRKRDGIDSTKLSHAPWVVIYFPGNAANRVHRALDCSDFTSLSGHVLLFDYRGYAENEGSPTETDLIADALALQRFVTEQHHVKPHRLVIYGESIGGAMATQLAAAMSKAGSPPAALILNSTFSSMVDTASAMYWFLPVRFMLLDRYLSIDHIPFVNCPILQIHGTADEIVPFYLGEKLFDAAPSASANGIPKKFVRMEHRGHNSLPVSTFRKHVSGLLNQAIPPQPAR